MKVKQIAFSMTDCLHVVGMDDEVYWYKKDEEKWIKLKDEGDLPIHDIGV